MRISLFFGYCLFYEIIALRNILKKNVSEGSFPNAYMSESVLILDG